MADWKPAIGDHRIETRFTGVGYEVRWALPVPRGRVRCDKCRKDVVPKLDGLPHCHICDEGLQYISASAIDRVARGFGYAKTRGKLKVFGTLSQAVAVAQYLSGHTARQEQIESRAMGAVEGCHAIHN